MSSAQRPERVVHQDFIARIRYSNQLPPPPNPPKLLDIPGTGLAGGPYTSASYASKLARAQPLNIEADAEIGMPIDLVGIPGVFDGDESAISTRANPYIHPADKALLKPLSSLTKSQLSGSSVSFLRRTEYTAPSGPQHFAATSELRRLKNDNKRKKQSITKDDPLNILRNVIKGFDIAYPKDAYRGEDSETSLRGSAISDAEARAWTNPRHPTRPELELLDEYPILPDLDALPDAGYYMVVKFINNPSTSDKAYDPRLDVGILRPVDDPKVAAQHEQRLLEWDEASGKPQPLAEFNYDFYIPSQEAAVRGIKRKFDVTDPENDDDALYTDDLPDGQRGFRYERVRTYETSNQHGDPSNLFNDTLALALHDPSEEVGRVPGVKKRLAKGAYFYPVIQRTALRPKRVLKNTQVSLSDDQYDALNIAVGDLEEEDISRRHDVRAKLDPSIGAA